MKQTKYTGRSNKVINKKLPDFFAGSFACLFIFFILNHLRDILFSWNAAW
jgi:hypothetical protein